MGRYTTAPVPMPRPLEARVTPNARRPAGDGGASQCQMRMGMLLRRLLSKALSAHVPEQPGRGLPE
jgi:hypothetical protein